MGWISYDIYGGDGTQSSHYDLLKKLRVAKDDDEADDMIQYKGTIIPKNRIPFLYYNIDKIKLKRPKCWNEDNAIDHQMVLALFVDNNLPVPADIKSNGIDATLYLMEEHADDFDNPNRRKTILKKFITKALDLKTYSKKKYL